MNCPNCGEAATSGANFCVRCGSRLPAGCPNCGEVNPEGSRFCRVCGAALAGAAAATFPRPAAVPCPRCRASNTPGADFCYACGLPFDEPVRQPVAQLIHHAYAGVPAGFWIRLLAWFLDLMLLGAIQWALLALLPGTSIETYYSGDAIWTGLDTFMLFFGMAYYTVGVAVFSTTVGKRLLGLYVLRPNGSRVGPGRAFARYWAPILSALILFIGFLMIAIRSDKRALHDLICDTVVVKR